ncbi:MAG: TIM barrel protein [Agathobacter sp.]|nr:TIM barrel protein [Agathobacter sp.]
MNYSLCADIMFVARGEKGPLWPDTDGIIAAMELAKANGLDGIEMFGLGGRDLPRILEASKNLEIPVRACVSVGATLLGDPDQTEALVEGFTQTVEGAKAIECGKIILNAEGYSKTLSTEEVFAVMVDQLKALAPIAEANQITILVEPLTGSYFTSAKQAFDLIRAVGSDYVKLLYDVFHFQNIDGKITTSIRENADLIGDIHFAGSPMRGEITVGELNYEFILQSIKESGYNGNICLEFFTFQNREEKVAVSAQLLNK